jgi:glutamine cyclotransferase
MGSSITQHHHVLNKINLSPFFLLIVCTLSFPPLTHPVHAREPVQALAKQSLRSAPPSPQPAPDIQPDRAPLKKPPPPSGSAVPVYGYRVVNVYPHDPGAFTQGLVYHDGRLYEGTGLHGVSSLRKVELETGRVLARRDLPGKYFGEGIAVCGNRLFQLTYQSRIGFIYDLDLRPVGSFSYATEGWGLTCDGDHLILSDGTATLRWIDMKTFRVMKELTVTDRGRPVERLNELEYIDGEIYANIWKTEMIAHVSPDTGRVTGWIDLSGLSQMAQAAAMAGKDRPGSGNGPEAPRVHEIDVLNGIAWDQRDGRIFVTGKFWPILFEIRPVKKKGTKKRGQIYFSEKLKNKSVPFF